MQNSCCDHRNFDSANQALRGDKAPSDAVWFEKHFYNIMWEFFYSQGLVNIRPNLTTIMLVVDKSYSYLGKIFIKSRMLRLKENDLSHNYS